MSKTTNQQKLAVLKVWLAELTIKRPKKKVVVVEEED
jgi:hypothetical protein